MNAITPQAPATAAARTERHLRMCQELAEMGMDLARDAHREALRDLQAPIEHRMPGMAQPPACRNPDPGFLFTQISRAVRQAILLEARIAAGAVFHATHRTPEAAQPPAPGQPNRTSRPAREHERLEDEFAVIETRAVPEILAAIAEIIGTPTPALPAKIPGKSPQAGKQRAPARPAIPARRQPTGSHPPPHPG